MNDGGVPSIPKGRRRRPDTAVNRKKTRRASNKEIDGDGAGDDDDDIDDDEDDHSSDSGSSSDGRGSTTTPIDRTTPIVDNDDDPDHNDNNPDNNDGDDDNGRQDPDASRVSSVLSNRTNSSLSSRPSRSPSPHAMFDARGDGIYERDARGINNNNTFNITNIYHDGNHIRSSTSTYVQDNSQSDHSTRTTTTSNSNVRNNYNNNATRTRTTLIARLQQDLSQLTQTVNHLNHTTNVAPVSASSSQSTNVAPSMSSSSRSSSLPSLRSPSLPPTSSSPPPPQPQPQPQPQPDDPNGNPDENHGGLQEGDAFGVFESNRTVDKAVWRFRTRVTGILDYRGAANVFNFESYQNITSSDGGDKHLDPDYFLEVMILPNMVDYRYPIQRAWAQLRLLASESDIALGFVPSTLQRQKLRKLSLLDIMYDADATTRFLLLTQGVYREMQTNSGVYMPLSSMRTFNEQNAAIMRWLVVSMDQSSGPDAELRRMGNTPITVTYTQGMRDGWMILPSNVQSGFMDHETRRLRSRVNFCLLMADAIDSVEFGMNYHKATDSMERFGYPMVKRRLDDSMLKNDTNVIDDVIGTPVSLAIHNALTFIKQHWLMVRSIPPLRNTVVRQQQARSFSHYAGMDSMKLFDVVVEKPVARVLFVELCALLYYTSNRYMKQSYAPVPIGRRIQLSIELLGQMFQRYGPRIEV